MNRDGWLKRLLRITDSHHGLINVELAREANLSRHHLGTAVKLGILERWLPRVYRLVGPAATNHQRIAAVQLWAEPDAAISHWTAASLHGLDIGGREETHVTTTRWVEAPAADIVVHTRSFLRTFDVCKVDGIRVTEPMRTLIDLAAVARPFVWESALDSLLRRGLDIDAFVDRFEATAIQGRNGTTLIRTALEARQAEIDLPEDLFERRLMNLFRDHGLPLPQCQHWVRLPGGRNIRLDFAFPDQRIAIEAQSYRWHSDREAWEKDRARLGELASLGWRVIEVTWRQVNDSPDEIVARVRRALRQPAS